MSDIAESNNKKRSEYSSIFGPYDINGRICYLVQDDKQEIIFWGTIDEAVSTYDCLNRQLTGIKDLCKMVCLKKQRDNLK